MAETLVTRPPWGRRIALDWKTARPLFWIGPLAAAAAGLEMSGRLVPSPPVLLQGLAAILLVNLLLGAWRGLWERTDWKGVLERHPVALGDVRGMAWLPYSDRNSPVYRLAQHWRRRAVLFSTVLWPELSGAFFALALAALASLALASTLGPVVLLLAGVALVTAPLGLWLGPEAGTWPKAVGEVGASWLIGHATLASLTPFSVGLAALFAAVFAGVLTIGEFVPEEIGDEAIAWGNVTQFVTIGVLLLLGRTVAAMLVGLTCLSLVLWQARARMSLARAGPGLASVEIMAGLAMLAAVLVG